MSHHHDLVRAMTPPHNSNSNSSDKLSVSSHSSHLSNNRRGFLFLKTLKIMYVYELVYRYYSDMTYHTHGLLRSLKKGRWNFFSGPGQFFYLTFFLSYGFIKVAAPFKEFSHPPLISYLDIYREFLVNIIFIMRKSLHRVDLTLSESTTKKLLNNSLKCLT